MTERFLVTGVAGFVGPHICQKLIDQNCDVICADNFFTGTLTNIAAMFDRYYFQILRHYIPFPLYVEVDEIYNLACPASPIDYQHDPVQTIKTSVLGAINILGLAKRLRARILQASTSEVYGDPDVHPQAEDYCGLVNIRGPRAGCDEGRRCAETLFYNYQRQHHLPIRVTRIFNTYGPNMHPQDGRVVSNFIVRALWGKPVTIYGTGEQTRSFCYVGDLVDGLVWLMSCEGDLSKPVNLGNQSEITIHDLASRIIDLTGSRSLLDCRPPLQDDPRQRCPNIGRATELLHWQPKVGLEDGLKRTIAYFEDLLSRHAPAVHQFSGRVVA